MSKVKYFIKTSSPQAVTLSWQYSCVSKMTYKPSKLGQTDLVFGLRSEFISRSVHTRLQVSKYSDMMCAILVNTQTYTDSF